MIDVVKNALNQIYTGNSPIFDEDYVTLPMIVDRAGHILLAIAFCSSEAAGAEGDEAVYPPRVIAFCGQDGSITWSKTDEFIAGVAIDTSGAMANLHPSLRAADPLGERERFRTGVSFVLTDAAALREVQVGRASSSPIADTMRTAFDHSAEVSLLPFYRALAPRFLGWLGLP